MASLSILQRLIDYLSKGPTLLLLLILVIPILRAVFKSKASKLPTRNSQISGCFRAGISKRSNLDDQYRRGANQSNRDDCTPRIKALFTYPIKSCRGVELQASEVGSCGLQYDRLFTFAQLVSSSNHNNVASNAGELTEASSDWTHQWRFITQREFPRLALIETELWLTKNLPTTHNKASKTDSISSEQSRDLLELTCTDDCGWLVLRFPFEPDFNLFGLRTEIVTIFLPLAPTKHRALEKNYKLETLSIWKDNSLAINITGEISSSDLAKLKYFLGGSNPLGLFRVDPSNRRPITRSLPKDKPGENYSVGFADAFPLHLLNLASVQAQDSELPSRSTFKGRLDARRFRANIYVNGPRAYDEDTWKRILVGRCSNSQSEDEDRSTNLSSSTEETRSVDTAAGFHIACRTARCKLPNVDQDTGTKDVNEPLTTLNRTRKVDKGAYPHPCLGMQMIPLFQNGVLRVGDEVQVLERGEHVYEKMFA